jgi:phospholipase C
MGFYNAEQEQATLLKQLADRFTLSDNFHQSFLGGTGANHVMFGHGDGIFWSDGKGHPVTPPASIANPNPKPGTVNQYTVDGNFVNCSDFTQPGVAPIVRYLEGLPYPAEPNCKERAYYMVNNVNPGYLPNGSGGREYRSAVIRQEHRRCAIERTFPAYFGSACNDAVILKCGCQGDPVVPA